MPLVPNSAAEILIILKLLLHVQGNGWFATDSQVCTRMSGGDPRTGTCHQMQVTAGFTNCSVKGVLQGSFPPGTKISLNFTLGIFIGIV